MNRDLRQDTIARAERTLADIDRLGAWNRCYTLPRLAYLKDHFAGLDRNHRPSLLERLFG